jgi:hypothetical protein
VPKDVTDRRHQAVALSDRQMPPHGDLGDRRSGCADVTAGGDGQKGLA